MFARMRITNKHSPFHLSQNVECNVHFASIVSLAFAKFLSHCRYSCACLRMCGWFCQWLVSFGPFATRMHIVHKHSLGQTDNILPHYFHIIYVTEPYYTIWLCSDFVPAHDRKPKILSMVEAKSFAHIRASCVHRVHRVHCVHCVLACVYVCVRVGACIHVWTFIANI